MPESKSGWDVDGVENRVILDYGAGFVDYRGWYANAGALWPTSPNSPHGAMR